jgi:hypothetical protein
MTEETRPSLAPMEAIEFAVAAVFRHVFFGLRLVLAWAVVLLPLAAAAWAAVFRDGVPDWRALPPAGLAALAAFGAGALLAGLSIAVNWNRRILLGETPRRLRWVRLDGPVWRYLAGVLLVLLVLALYAGAAFGAATRLGVALEAQLGPAAKPLGIAVAALIGLSALFTLYRLCGWLAGLAVEDGDFRLRAAWRVTRSYRLAYLGFTFWLLFTLAVVGALGAGAFFAQQAIPEPWVKAVAFIFIGLLAWLSIFFLATVPASHYRQFATPS